MIKVSDCSFYRRCGKSGLLLPAVSMGLWHNFGDVDNFPEARKIIRGAFDLGITHFDLANNYGPPPGTAEINFGKILKKDLQSYRDKIIISTKAGYKMWEGPYGDGGSRKYLISSIDQSLKRMGLDYVDIFYHHRPDTNTPLAETMGALDHIVRQGKALYVGISNYNPEQTRQAYKILKSMGTPFVIHQTPYNLFLRKIEKELIETIESLGIGCIVFSPLAQGLLSNKYINGIPENSRAAKEHGSLKKEDITKKKIHKIKRLDDLANRRGQTLAQMALAWILRRKAVTSVLVGASNIKQVKENIKAVNNVSFSEEELNEIDLILND